ncbi:chemotaxis protein CheW [Halorubrum aidingense JCM 13560]|uniref:Chemotaxis protein CheW n=1 Tax=Halorubrum aidingense JCM 13560 TaxID=1230454 RepID=M0PLT2_9EURY|nr:chemotaxis protein CheW [Halorubrum aidingense]EMA69715.1 chemotaxis protein CheW [Halorubrum aidingense JCM 13560]
MAEPLGELLEFRLGGERYCLDIAYVDEIVTTTDIRSIPNAPDHVTGVTDLRGRTTTVVDPGVVLDVDDERDRTHIVVLDDEELTDTEGTVGWLVEDVRQVITASEDDVDRTPAMDDTPVAGVISNDSEFVVQLDPRTVAT